MDKLKRRMIDYLVAQECAQSTITTYSNAFDKILWEVKSIEDKDNAFWIKYLGTIKDPIYRNNIRSVVLKVVRDVLGKHIVLPLVKRPIRLQPIYTYDEVKLIFKQIKNKKHLAIAKLLFVEGFRVGEVTSILLSDCDKKDSAIIIRNTKSNSDFKKYIDVTTAEAINDYIVDAKNKNLKPKKFLFEGWANSSYTSSSIRQFMRKAMKDAKVEVKGSCHIFRRSSSVWKIESGWSAKHIAASLNNSERTVNKYYAYARPDYMKTLPKPIA